MNKDIEGLKTVGSLLFFTGLSMKALAAARQNENSSETDRQTDINDRNDIEIGDTSEIEPFSNKKL